MAAKIAILGESTTVATGTTTLYTVPLDKASRIRLHWTGENNGSASIYQFAVGTPGSEITISCNMNSSLDSGSGPLEGADPSGMNRANDHGAFQIAAVFTLDSTSGSNSWTAQPLAADYYLSTGDTVDFVLTTSVYSDNLCHVFGVEDDA